MAVIKKVNVFAVVILILVIALIVFLSFCAAYFFQMGSSILPSYSQTMFMAWMCIVILIILALVLIYAFIMTLRGQKEYIEDKKPESNMKKSSKEKAQAIPIQTTPIPQIAKVEPRTEVEGSFVVTPNSANVAANELLRR